MCTQIKRQAFVHEVARCRDKHSFTRLQGAESLYEPRSTIMQWLARRRQNQLASVQSGRTTQNTAQRRSHVWYRFWSVL